LDPEGLGLSTDGTTADATAAIINTVGKILDRIARIPAMVKRPTLPISGRLPRIS
jgi:hypothetical protein